MNQRNHTLSGGNMPEEIAVNLSDRRQELLHQYQPHYQPETQREELDDTGMDMLLGAISRREEHIIEEVMRSRARADQALRLAEFAISNQLDQTAIKAIVSRAVSDSRSDIEKVWEKIRHRTHEGREKQRIYQSLIREMRIHQAELGAFGKIRSWQAAKWRKKALLLQTLSKVQEEALTTRQNSLNLYDEITRYHEQMNHIISDFIRLMDQALKPHRISLLSIVPVEDSSVEREVE